MFGPEFTYHMQACVVVKEVLSLSLEMVLMAHNDYRIDLFTVPTIGMYCHLPLHSVTTFLHVVFVSICFVFLLPSLSFHPRITHASVVSIPKKDLR